MELIDLWLDWVEANLDKQVPLHFSAFFPTHKYHLSPRTSKETLLRIRETCGKNAVSAPFIWEMFKK